MIQLPRRSVTRFFIPLIDVLTLLFCIFLLLPLIQRGQGPESTAQASTASAMLRGSAGAGKASTPASLREADLAERLRQERVALGRLQREKIATLQNRLSVRILEIDADSGKLYYQDGDRRQEIRSQADAQNLMQHQEGGGREVYYLFLFPRRLTGYPEERQMERYDRWFKGVAHGIDNPLGGR